jgi:transcriptional regulator with XRE-family HTH domain
MQESTKVENEIGKVLSNIRKVRELRNVTRDQLAADLGLSSSGYSKIERGEIELTLLRLYQIADALEVKAQQILEFDVSQLLGKNHLENTASAFGPQTLQIDLARKYIEKLEEENLRLKSELSAYRQTGGNLNYNVNLGGQENL